MERSVEEAMFRFDEMEQKYEAESKKQNKMKQQLEVTIHKYRCCSVFGFWSLSSFF